MNTYEALQVPAPDIELYAFATLIRAEGKGVTAIHLALRAPGMVMNYNMRMDMARVAHARLGEALRTFDVARELVEDVQPATISPEHVDMMRLQTPASSEQAMDQTARQQPNPALQALSARTIREQERLYRAKLAVRLGLAEDDIRAVFDLSADELAFLREEVAGA